MNLPAADEGELRANLVGPPCLQPQPHLAPERDQIAFYDAVKSCLPVQLTFHEPVSREIRDGFADTSQRTAVVPATAPGAARVSRSSGSGGSSLSGASTAAGIKSSFSIALICTRSRRFPASASTNQGYEKGDWHDSPQIFRIDLMQISPLLP